MITLNEIFESIFEKIIGTARYHLSKLDRKNELHKVRRFAKKNDACDDQYNNLVQLMKYHTNMQCWQFILGNYRWLYHCNFELLTFDEIKKRAAYIGKRYYSNLILDSVLEYPPNYPFDTFRSIIVFHRFSKMISNIDYHNENGLLTERYDYYYNYLMLDDGGVPRLVYTVLIDGSYHVYSYSYNGFIETHYTRTASYNKHGNYLIYHHNSDKIRFKEVYNHGDLESSIEYDLEGNVVD